MFFHLLKPIWKRKFKNMMLSLEILLAFVVVFAVSAMGLRYWQLYQLPLGFQAESVWSVGIHTGEGDVSKASAGMSEQFKRSLEALPEVERVAFSNYTPYSNSTWFTQYRQPHDAKKVDVNIMEVSDDFFKVLGMQTSQGAWFSAADEATPAIVINRSAAQGLFGDKDPIGQILTDSDTDEKATKLMKVTGVFDDFRNKGEFMTPTNFVLLRHSTLNEKEMLHTILLKLKPGTSRIFEVKLNQQLKLVRNDWRYRIAPLSALRHDLLLEQSTPLIVLAVIASFLLIMVAFGLFGVLWQNTTRRIPEIGLRRAMGAHAGNIYRQIIAEQLLLSSLAMVVGMVLLIQLPLTGALGANLNWSVFVAASVLSVALIYGLSILCSLYPAWQASRLSPTQALHYE